MQFIPHLVQKSCRSYEHPTPNAQQQPPTHARAPATLNHNKPQPFYSSSPRQGSSSPEMLNTAAKHSLHTALLGVLTLSSLSPPADLPIGLQMEKRDSSKLPSLAPFDGGGKLYTYVFSIPH